VNYLAHAQLIGDLLGSFTAPARIVFLGSNTYRGNLARRMIGAPGAQWRDPVDLARPAADDKSSGLHGAGVAYATSKLAIVYYIHELQRHAGDGIGVSVFEPGFMPGTGLAPPARPGCPGAGAGPGAGPGACPWDAYPVPLSAGTRLGRPRRPVGLPPRWHFHLEGQGNQGGTRARDRDRERRLWQATTDLLERATLAGT
jgi:NAD(P)-dependent dehydrogenase (short-subunit alcohol dehydrogenase family)